MKIVKSGALTLQRGSLLLSVVWTLSSPVLAQVTGTIQGQITDATSLTLRGQPELIPTVSSNWR